MEKQVSMYKKLGLDKRPIVPSNETIGAISDRSAIIAECDKYCKNIVTNMVSHRVTLPNNDIVYNRKQAEGFTSGVEYFNKTKPKEVLEYFEKVVKQVKEHRLDIVLPDMKEHTNTDFTKGWVKAVGYCLAYPQEIWLGGNLTNFRGLKVVRK